MVEILSRWADSGGLFLAAFLLGLLAVMAYCVGAVALTWYDAREHRLPRRWVHPLYPVVILPLALAMALTGSAGALVSGLCGAAATGAFYGLIRLASPASMGLGDVRLAPLLGWVLGCVSLAHVVVGLMASFFLAGLWAGVLVIFRRATLGSHIALGPWMLWGTLVCWLFLPARLI